MQSCVIGKAISVLFVRLGHKLSSMANGPEYTAAESAEFWNRQSLMVKMKCNDAGQ